MKDWDVEYEGWKETQKTKPLNVTEEASSSEEYYDKKENSRACFTYKETKGCVMGKNMKTIKRTTLKKCQMACDKEKRCKGVEFFKASGVSNTSPTYREGDCLLNSDTNLKRCDADYWQMYFW